LTLWPCSEADIDLLYRHWTDPDVRRFLWDGRIISKDTVREFVRDSLNSSHQHDYGLWVLWSQAEREFRGGCGLRDSELPEPELLYSVPPQNWGRGIATESAQGVLRHAFVQLALPQVIATVDKPNMTSIHVLERLGFLVTDEQVIHDHPILYYAVSSQRWKELHGTVL
jgi:[ribosomal protein S5]-alanine N-acetyltransferase